MENVLGMSKVDAVITYLNSIEVDGDTMEYIIKEVGMKEQMLRQLIMSSPVRSTRDLFEERVSSVG
jgi:hypothetical protein